MFSQPTQMSAQLNCVNGGKKVPMYPCWTLRGLLVVWDIFCQLRLPNCLETWLLLLFNRSILSLTLNGHTEIVSVDRLKKARLECGITYLDIADTHNFNPLQSPLHTPTPLFSSPSPLDSSPLYKTKSGRTVHWPKKLSRAYFIWFDLFVYLLLFVFYT